MRRVFIAHSQILSLMALILACPATHGQVVARFRNKSEVGHAQAVAFSPDGALIAVGYVSKEASLKVWDVKTKKELAGFEAQGGWVRAVTFSPDGKTLASAGTGGVLLLDVAAGKRVGALPNKQTVNAIAFSPDGKKMVTSDTEITIFGKREATDRDNLMLWDLEARKQLVTVESDPGSNRSVSWSSDGKHLVTRDQGTGGLIKFCQLHFRDPNTLKVKKTMAGGFTPGFGGMAISADSKLLAFDDYPRERMVVWDLAADKEKWVWKYDSKMTHGIVFSPDGRLLATVSSQGLQIWGVSSGKKLPGFPGGAAISGFITELPAFSPKGLTLAVGGDDGDETEVILFDVAKLKSAP